MVENADPSSSSAANARLGGQQGALKALDVSEIETPSGTRSRVVHPRGQKVVPLYQRTFVRPGRLLAPPVPPARHVLMALTGGAIIFFIAGGRFDEMLERVRGRPVSTEDPQPAGVVFQTVLGWGTLLTILVFMADTGVAAPLAVGFSWLIFLMIVMAYGEEAGKRIVDLLGGPDEPTPIGGGGSRPLLQ